MLDLTGQRFGRLTAIEPTDERKGTSVVWRCICDCGKECLVPSDWLRRGGKRSCGCLQDENRRRDITGQKRGHLTAIEPTDERCNGQTVWLWRCDCGATVRKTAGAVGASASTMCPECARRLKGEQARAMFARVERDEKGRSVRQVEAIRAGKPTAQNSSGVRGVYWDSVNRKWVPRISDGHGKTVTLGNFSRIEDAAAARKRAVEELYGK